MRAGLRARDQEAYEGIERLEVRSHFGLHTLINEQGHVGNEDHEAPSGRKQVFEIDLPLYQREHDGVVI